MIKMHFVTPVGEFVAEFESAKEFWDTANKDGIVFINPYNKAQHISIPNPVLDNSVIIVEEI